MAKDSRSRRGKDAPIGRRVQISARAEDRDRRTALPVMMEPPEGFAIAGSGATTQSLAGASKGSQ
jgi:hypothetical protein